MRRTLILTLIALLFACAVVATEYTATITTDKDVVGVGETVTITVTISPPTAGVTITVKIIDPRGAERTLPPATTDAEGKAVFYWTVETGAPVGTYTLEAYISGQAGVAASKTIRVITPPPVGGKVLPTDKFELIKLYVASNMPTLTTGMIVLIAVAIILTIISRRIK